MIAKRWHNAAMPETAPTPAFAFDFDLHIEADIAVAKTMPARFYSDPAVFAAARQRLFARTWQLAADIDAVRVPQQIHPFSFMESYLDEPAAVDARQR
jgi:choline monooxygenase